MDFVPNHSSDQHEWFIKSVNKDPDYDEFYIWKDPKGFDEDGKPIPPNNWVWVHACEHAVTYVYLKNDTNITPF